MPSGKPPSGDRVGEGLDRRVALFKEVGDDGDDGDDGELMMVMVMMVMMVIMYLVVMSYNQIQKVYA